MATKTPLIIFLALILLSIPTLAYPCIRYHFQDEQGNSIANIGWAIWACSDPECTNVDPTYWHETGNSGSDSYADIKFRPTLPPSGEYIIYFFHNDYRAKYLLANPYWPKKPTPMSATFGLVGENPPSHSTKKTTAKPTSPSQ